MTHVHLLVPRPSFQTVLSLDGRRDIHEFVRAHLAGHLAERLLPAAADFPRGRDELLPHCVQLRDRYAVEGLHIRQVAQLNHQ